MRKKFNKLITKYLLNLLNLQSIIYIHIWRYRNALVTLILCQGIHRSLCCALSELSSCIATLDYIPSGWHNKSEAPSTRSMITTVHDGFTISASMPLPTWKWQVITCAWRIRWFVNVNSADGWMSDNSICAFEVGTSLNI